ncbi:MAG: SUMF1/EgtB/PvdO family nonheme iron enzyme [Sandaracinaceae bacterium]|nr:SUMF1/EgtB/PvdO family nonheme iron enzyme [Sandaracinaceae bacterium]
MSDVLSHRAIADRLARGRAKTLAFVADLDDAALCAWPSEDFSPLGWHLGHVGFTEAHWILERCAGRGELSAPFSRAWAQGGCPKRERTQQPPKAELLAYLARVRDAVLEVLPTLALDGDDPLVRGGFVGWFVEAHEHQHRETMAIVRQLALEAQRPPPPPPSLRGAPVFAAVAGGTLTMGTDAPLAYDNERPAHEVRVAPFALSEPITAGAWDTFRAAGGYETRALWTDEGWAWREALGVTHPRGWTRDTDGALARVTLDGRLRHVAPSDPVAGVSCHEAEALARFFDARLPTEAEWERAAAHGEPREPAWVWTSTTFGPYDGFAPFPYRGYSEPYFDGRHRVLKGGSSATDPSVARRTFRNFYLPETRAIFAGVRLARG